MTVRWSSAARAQLNPGARTKEIADDDYVNFVRRFPPSKLVGLIAALSPDYAFGQQDYARNSFITPWALADVARVSLTFSNEHRRAEPTPQDLLTCLHMHNELGHRDLTEDADLDVVANTLLQLAFYQFPLQRAHGNSLGRSLALFEETSFPTQHPAEVMQAGWQQQLLGCSLADYIAVAELLAAAAKPNNGRFNPEWIENPDFPQEIREICDPATIRLLLVNFLSRPANSFKERDRERPSVDRRFTFNPLIESPIVSGLGPDLLMPVPDFLLWKPTPSGLYFTGLRRWDEAFTRDLGHLFEAYIGRQLALVSNAILYPEVQYGKGNDKSIDWFLVFPDLVLLVEVKVARPKQPLRSGAAGAAEALRGAFNKAFKQLDRTYDLIQSRRQEFQHIPVDRPIVGVVVTLEDFHLANSALHEPCFSKSTKLPTRAICSDELERLVSLDSDISSFLRTSITMPIAGPDLREVLSREPAHDNPIIRAGIDASPIFQLRDSLQPQE